MRTWLTSKYGLNFPPILIELLLLLQYYADQGGLTSARALELVKSRFNAESLSSAASSALAATAPTVLPNFFQMTA